MSGASGVHFAAELFGFSEPAGPGPAGPGISLAAELFGPIISEADEEPGSSSATVDPTFADQAQMQVHEASAQVQRYMGSAQAIQRPSSSSYHVGGLPPAEVFGAAKRARHAHMATTATPLVEVATHAVAVTSRPKATLEEMRLEKLGSQHLQEAFFGAGHKCRNLQPSGKACHVALWGPDLEQLRNHLKLCLPSQRKHFTKKTTVGDEEILNTESRRNLVISHLVAVNEDRQDGKFECRVNGRVVCAPIFALHWGISKASLERYMSKAKEMKLGIVQPPDRRPREAIKYHYIVAWVCQYAESSTEKLPDCDKLLIPSISWGDLHSEFAADMRAAGVDHICCPQYFRSVFKSAPELNHIEMNRHKKNFGKCGECMELCAKVAQALKGHDAVALMQAKADRLVHYGLARADKINYYRQREVARQPTSLKMTLIIDKMDSAKNHVPWYSRGRKPKDCEELLKDTLKLHLTGVIIHGRPDKRYMFWSLPYLPGNGNLNIECIRRALVHHLGGTTLKPKLYIQVDNASDNKNYTVLLMFAWLVHHDYVSQVS